jgi:phosphoribosylformylglycinamidine synthase
MTMTRFYRTPALSASEMKKLSGFVSGIGFTPRDVLCRTEHCYYVETPRPLTEMESEKLHYMLSETYGQEEFYNITFLNLFLIAGSVFEFGPRLNFETPWSSAAVAACVRCDVPVTRLERSTRIGLPWRLTGEEQKTLGELFCDRMTEMVYSEPLTSFDTSLVPAPLEVIPLLEGGIPALSMFNKRYGCAWDEDDMRLIARIYFKMGRNPTDVELFQIAQSTTAEHSRHWAFKGEQYIDGVRVPERHLMDIVRAPLASSASNSVIAFKDDSSAICGRHVRMLVATDPLGPSEMVMRRVLLHPTMTAETHNFPTGVAPFPGAATGGGGRIRDNQAVGRGGLVVASGAGYNVGNLHIPGYALPWEEDGWKHTPDLASPLDILIEASNGASAYGNCFGEPLTLGFTRSFGQTTPDGHRSYFKPIMYSIGSGEICDIHVEKGVPKEGMLVIVIGGPNYRIGMGGGSASSMEQGANEAHLDFNAVQRGNPEMGNRCNRFIRACIEMLHRNPMKVVHDEGAGGNCNAIPEAVYPAGAIIKMDKLPLGDLSLSEMEIWGNESQERIVITIYPSELETVQTIANRENVPLAIVGHITGDGILIVFKESDGTTPVHLNLEDILGQLEPKTFNFERLRPNLNHLELPVSTDFQRTLEWVLRLPSVCSKRFLTNKVDRSVTGLISQQQHVGPMHLPLSDYAIEAQGYENKSGVARSLGEQPIVGMLDPGAGSRMTVAEAMLNLAGSGLRDRRLAKAEANWMLAIKQPGQGAWLYDAACALRDICISLGTAIDGGKDSLSMASGGIAPDGTTETVVAPATLVFAPYLLVDDVNIHVTPNLKRAGHSLYFFSLGNNKRLGGSALAQVLGQLGNEAPDIEDSALLGSMIDAIGELVHEKAIVAGHDCVGDGGLIVTLLEMAFGGDKGFRVALSGKNVYEVFSQEAGYVVEVRDQQLAQRILKRHSVPFEKIGVVQNDVVELAFNSKVVLLEQTRELLKAWDETSYQIERIQANPRCVDQERKSLDMKPLTKPYYLSFNPDVVVARRRGVKPLVAVLREEGTNGDREMVQSLREAGFRVFDINMQDLIDGNITLKNFQLVAFPGGFSFGDVLDSAKGWASVIKFNDRLREEIYGFLSRPDTLSLSVCNGCQLMALLGIPGYELSDSEKPRFVTNESERFESRFPTVTILRSPAIMLSGMEGSTLGVHVAHGEGCLHVPSRRVMDWILRNGYAPIRYVDPEGSITESYPFNPNGSPRGIAALCSPDGRHLAMMPHPERTTQWRQWPYIPNKWNKYNQSPWHRMFVNAARAF